MSDDTIQIKTRYEGHDEWATTNVKRDVGMVEIVNEAVPHTKLEELIDEWRDCVEIACGDREIGARNQTLTQCADELEALIKNE